MRLSDSWRRPRGVHNKKRRRRKTKGKRPLIGHRGPKLVRRANAKGYFERLCFARADVLSTPAKYMALLSSKSGLRKKMQYENLADAYESNVVNKFNWNLYKS